MVAGEQCGTHFCRFYSWAPLSPPGGQESGWHWGLPSPFSPNILGTYLASCLPSLPSCRSSAGCVCGELGDSRRLGVHLFQPPKSPQSPRARKVGTRVLWRGGRKPIDVAHCLISLRIPSHLQSPPPPTGWWGLNPPLTACSCHLSFCWFAPPNPASPPNEGPARKRE